MAPLPDNLKVNFENFKVLSAKLENSELKALADNLSQEMSVWFQKSADIMKEKDNQIEELTGNNELLTESLGDLLDKEINDTPKQQIKEEVKTLKNDDDQMTYYSFPKKEDVLIFQKRNKRFF